MKMWKRKQKNEITHEQKQKALVMFCKTLVFALSVAVGLTPEMLPMIVTANLSRGAIKMAKKKTIVKNMNAIQNFGAMNILCTDKTGTLTRDQIVLEKYINSDGSEDKDKRILRHAYF